MTHFLKPSCIKTVLLRTPFSYGIITFACLSSTANYDVQVPSCNNFYCALYSRMICWLRIQSMMICLHIFCCSFTRVSSLQSCRVLSTCYSEWRFHWERRMLDRPTKQWEPLQGFLRNDNWWRYLGAFCFQVLIFFSVIYRSRFFFFFLMQRRLDDIVKRYWKESSVQLRRFCDFFWSTTTCQLETFGKFMSVEIHLLAITL